MVNQIKYNSYVTYSLDIFFPREEVFLFKYKGHCLAYVTLQIKDKIFLLPLHAYNCYNRTLQLQRNIKNRIKQNEKYQDEMYNNALIQKHELTVESCRSFLDTKGVCIDIKKHEEHILNHKYYRKKIDIFKKPYFYHSFICINRTNRQIVNEYKSWLNQRYPELIILIDSYLSENKKKFHKIFWKAPPPKRTLPDSYVENVDDKNKRKLRKINTKRVTQKDRIKEIQETIKANLECISLAKNQQNYGLFFSLGKQIDIINSNYIDPQHLRLKNI